MLGLLVLRLVHYPNHPKVMLNCDEGYMAMGYSVAVCQDDGRLTKPLGKVHTGEKPHQKIKF